MMYVVRLPCAKQMKLATAWKLSRSFDDTDRSFHARCARRFVICRAAEAWVKDYWVTRCIQLFFLLIIHAILLGQGR
jgi:hypothetical protein